MSDELMRQIQEGLDAEYRRGFDEGWYDGHAAAWGAIAEWATTQEAAARKAPEPSPQDEAEEDSSEQPLEMQEQAEAEPGLPSWFETVPDVVDSERPAVTERRLSPAQQRAVDYVRENPGLKAWQLQGIGRGILYGLVKSGVLAKRGAQFYPAEHA